MVSERPEEIVQYKCYPSRRYQSAPNIIAYRRSRRKECTFAPNGMPILVVFLGFFIAFTSFLKICRRRPPGEESSGFAASINFSHPADPLQWVRNVWCSHQCHFPTTRPFDFGMLGVCHCTVRKSWILWYCSHCNAKDSPSPLIKVCQHQTNLRKKSFWASWVKCILLITFRILHVVLGSPTNEFYFTLNL